MTKSGLTYRSFIEAKKFAHSMELQNREQWLRYVKDANKPNDIPSRPERTYKNQWKGWGDWLGLIRHDILPY